MQLQFVSWLMPLVFVRPKTTMAMGTVNDVDRVRYHIWPPVFALIFLSRVTFW